MPGIGTGKGMGWPKENASYRFVHIPVLDITVHSSETDNARQKNAKGFGQSRLQCAALRVNIEVKVKGTFQWQ